MIDVRVREEEELEGHWVGAFKPSEIYQLPDLFATFDTNLFTDGGDAYGPSKFVSAQWSNDGRNAFFEIVVSQNKE